MLNMTNNTISTFAGNGNSGFSGDGGYSTNAQISTPSSLALDMNNQLLFFTDSANNDVRYVNVSTNIIQSLIAQGRTISSPLGIAIDPSNSAGYLVYVSSSSNYYVYVKNMNTSTLTVYAGTGNQGYTVSFTLSSS
jgi:sugar lactone lactonase YvrE